MSLARMEDAPMMTLRETIKMLDAMASSETLSYKAAHWRAIAEWLRELRRLRHKITRLEGHKEYDWYKHSTEPEE